MNVADLLNVPVSEVDDRTTWLEKKFPAIYTSTPSEYLKTFVDSVYVPDASFPLIEPCYGCHIQYTCSRW